MPRHHPAFVCGLSWLFSVGTVFRLYLYDCTVTVPSHPCTILLANLGGGRHPFSFSAHVVLCIAVGGVGGGSLVRSKCSKRQALQMHRASTWIQLPARGRHASAQRANRRKGSLCVVSRRPEQPILHLLIMNSTMSMISFSVSACAIWYARMRTAHCTVKAKQSMYTVS